jgi:hypothetical protein
MKLLIIVSTSALMLGAAGLTPAVAEPFNDQGPNWTTVSPTLTQTSRVSSPTLPPDGSFASSWGSGRTPTFYEGSSSAVRSDRPLSCTLTSRIGFNERNIFPTC